MPLLDGEKSDAVGCDPWDLAWLTVDLKLGLRHLTEDAS